MVRLSHSLRLYAAASFLALPWASALNCKDLTISGQHYDLSALDKEHVVKVKVTTPPTYTMEEYSLNPCQALTKKDEVPKDDQCPVGTFVCRTDVNYKAEKPRVTWVQPVSGGQDDGASPAITVPKASPGSDPETSPKLQWTMRGPTVDKTDYRCDINLICDKEAAAAKSVPTFVSMKDGVLTLDWKSDAVCLTKRTDPKKPDEPEKKPDDEPKPDEPAHSSGSGFFGTLFKIIGILLLVYFVVGIIYNYAIAGATGLDLIPHRYFWQDLPSLCVEFVQYIYQSCGGRRRGGYSAV
ncbi:type II membrane protein [Tieghemiomyces parasiticus]|uniref:Autophagy-related protein 27 n=1 Tax=Tieghemiomyces parasiticus TaxID=78921 RepID=A0A9W8A1V8_9FUNG|nr:type II membrane protein [Tieghemiomyces parasiticus]